MHKLGLGADKLSVLVIGSGAASSLERAYLRAFGQVGIDRVEFLDTDRYRLRFKVRATWAKAVERAVELGIPLELAQRLRRTIKGTRPDLIFVFKGYELSRKLLEECRTLCPSAVWVNINPDDPFSENRAASNDNIRSSIDFFDVYFIWSRRLVTALKEAGCRHVEFLAFGYDPAMHRPALGVELTGVVSFVGSWDPMRESVLSTLRRFDMLICGNGWENARTRFGSGTRVLRRAVIGAEFSDVVARSAICINILRPQNAGSHNMRTFEVPAMRGTMLTNRTEEQNEFFPEDDACLMYGDGRELESKVEDAIGDVGRVNRIREIAYELARPHSYAERLRMALSAIS